MTQHTAHSTQHTAHSTQHTAHSTQPPLSVKFEEYERERLDEIYDEVAPYSEMAKNERYFLNGIIRYLKPSKILEVGIANGGGTVIILNAIRDLDNSYLISADYCEKFYAGDSSKPSASDKLSGWLIDDKFPYLKDKWTVYRGGDVSRYVEIIRGNIDMLVLDTAHSHPWETLNFLCVLPFMKKDSWCVLHDISLPIIGRFNDLACRYLYGHAASDIKVMPVSDYDSYFANIGAFHVTEDTIKYVQNLFESLLNLWTSVPDVYGKAIPGVFSPMRTEDFNDIKNIISKYYPQYMNLFNGAVKAQQDIAAKRIKEYRSLNGIWKRNLPLSYALIHTINTRILKILSMSKNYVRHHFPRSFETAKMLKRKLYGR